MGIQLREPEVYRRNGMVRFVDADYGHRTPHERSQPHIDGNATRRAIQRANDPVLRECGR